MSFPRIPTLACLAVTVAEASPGPPAERGLGDQAVSDVPDPVVRPTAEDFRLRRSLVRLAAAVALLVALATPLILLLFSYVHLAGSVEREVELMAGDLSRFIQATPEPLRSLRPRLAEMLAPAAREKESSIRRLLDREGIVVSVGTAPPPPFLLRAAPVGNGAETIGRLEIARSFRPALGEAALAAVASGILALAVLVVLAVLPLRLLDRYLASHEDSRRRFAARFEKLKETNALLEQRSESLARRIEELERSCNEAEAANRAKAAFVANLSHELRTPLNAIIGFSEIMREQMFGPLGDPHYDQYAADILRSGQHLLDIVDGILDLSKAEAGEIELRESVVDLPELLDATVRAVRAAYRHHPFDLVLSLPDEPLQLWGDAQRLKQILFNLLSNAVKFTPNGGRIEVAVSVSPTNGLELKVSDSGVGIAAKDLDRVMAPFQQAHNDLDRRYRGTGLGLPLTDALVRLHGGALTLDSRIGEGTVATVRLPGERVLDPHRRIPPAAG